MSRTLKKQDLDCEDLAKVRNTYDQCTEYITVLSDMNRKVIIVNILPTFELKMKKYWTRYQTHFSNVKTRFCNLISTIESTNRNIHNPSLQAIFTSIDRYEELFTVSSLPTEIAKQIQELRMMAKKRPHPGNDELESKRAKNN